MIFFPVHLKEYIAPVALFKFIFLIFRGMEVTVSKIQKQHLQQSLK